VIRAVRAVLAEPAYAGRLPFEVFGWESERGKAAQKAYCFGAERHGLVVLAADGHLIACRAGHFYGEAEIRQSFDLALGR